MSRLNLEDLTRKPLIIGTSRITDETGEEGYKTEYVQASAQLRIAAALERQNELAQQALVARNGFSPANFFDGLNHLRAHWGKGDRLVRLDFLASSPAKAEEFLDGVKLLLETVQQIADAMAAAQEGGPANV